MFLHEFKFQPFNFFSQLQNLKVKVSREGSNKSEKSENSNEKKLEAVGVKPKDKSINLNIVTNSRFINLALCRSSQESWDSCTLLALKLGESILENVFLVSRESSLTGLCCLLVELRITLDLKTWVSEVWYLVRRWWCLVSSSRDVELDLGCCISNRWVSLRCWWCRSSCRLRKGEEKKVSQVVSILSFFFCEQE